MLAGGLWGLWKTDKGRAAVGAGVCPPVLCPSGIQEVPLASGVCVCVGGSSSRSQKFLGCPQQSLSPGTANVLQRTLGPGSAHTAPPCAPAPCGPGPDAQMVSAATHPSPHTCTRPRRGSGPWVTCPCTWALQPTLDVVEGRQSCLLLGLWLTVGGARRADHPTQLHGHREGQAGVWGRRG